ncbi:hypothetical protein LCGC14_0772780 [marine sediment metagenome]|uniref:RagB/SusD family nutrient uptake outer membrane protein n=2 Tax=root TaxID=1 RepID=A0A831VT79_9FLAO|nr:RagB/SusD family nutrient uptake outer membrane protein [Pricia antarctica]
MKKFTYILLLTAALAFTGCDSDEEFLDRPPAEVLTEEQLFSDQAAILSVLGDLYDRYYDFGTVQDWSTLANFNVSFWSENGRYGEFQNDGWPNNLGSTWDYGYIREINLFLERAEASTTLDDQTKARFTAEARFLRVSYYFELVKRMGGVPLVLETLEYDFSGDASYLQRPRETEAAVYDFIITESNALADILPSDPTTKSRATRGAVLALQTRAAIYAASIAKYGATTPLVSLPGGEVGIPASRAEGYYQQALTSAQSIIDGTAGEYSLYQKKPDLSDNFASIFYDKSANPEAIFVEDFLLANKAHYFTGANQPRFGAEEEEGGRINPSLQFVQSFELLNGTYAPLPVEDASGDKILYEARDSLFNGRDARLQGTVMVPGSSFKGLENDIWAGVQLADGTIISGEVRGQQKEVPGTTGQQQVVGFDGPINGVEHTAQTGFYIRKYQDPKIGSGRRGTQSDVWFIRYRFAEVLLNAAEAAFELGQPELAAGYLNQVRERAGITVPLTAAEVDFDRIVHERYVELAFEGLYFFDLRRWRLGHIIFDGVEITEDQVTQNIGSATKRQTQPWGVWPYKYIEPGSPDDGKWIFEIVKPDRVTGADRFRFGNYYSEIAQDILTNNPLLVRNPNQ